MTRSTFLCIDAHTCGNPVRVVHGAVPSLRGATMSDRRQDFLRHHDWIRRALMFEPRGHDVMSGAILYPPIAGDADAAVLFIETSGCLPMCGHGLIGTVTVALEHGLIRPRIVGQLTLEVPAGLVRASYSQQGGKVTSVRITNVGSYLAQQDIVVNCSELGSLLVDVAYGGNFYAIVEPQQNYPGLARFTVADILRYSPLIRKSLNASHEFVHPENPTVRDVSHLMWTSEPGAGADGANAVFYGERAIDRSPCGTGTSARMAQLVAKGRLQVGDTFVHESIIRSRFIGRVEAQTRVGAHVAIIPSIEGSAWVTGVNTIFVDDAEPYPQGFQIV
jgi:4-hydroxyproline epimerase